MSNVPAKIIAASNIVDDAMAVFSPEPAAEEVRRRVEGDWDLAQDVFEELLERLLMPAAEPPCRH